jgi:hypothetical protein
VAFASSEPSQSAQGPERVVPRPLLTRADDHQAYARDVMVALAVAAPAMQKSALAQICPTNEEDVRAALRELHPVEVAHRNIHCLLSTKAAQNQWRSFDVEQVNHRHVWMVASRTVITNGVTRAVAW